jgi:hypothetical protein
MTMITRGIAITGLALPIATNLPLVDAQRVFVSPRDVVHPCVRARASEARPSNVVVRSTLDPSR